MAMEREAEQKAKRQQIEKHRVVSLERNIG